MASTIKITKGQPFVLWIPTIILNADSKVPVDSSTLSNVSVHVSSVCNGVDITPSVNYYEHWIVLGFDADLIVGPYRVEVTGDLASGRSFCLRMSKPFEVVQWDHESNWRDYLVGDHIELCDQPFIAGEFTTNAEYEELKRQLREQITAAEQAEAEALAEKERYAEAIEHLDDIAQGITGYALQGSDQAATNTAILQAIQSVAGLATEANATANKNEVLAAIAANAGIPTLTIPDSTASQELAPNVLYIFATRTSTLTLTLGTPIVGIANEYHFFIVCGSTAPTVNFPSGISWNGGNAPTIAADKTYEVSILNNVAAYFEV